MARKVTLSVIEKLEYEREIIVEVPDEMTGKELESLLDKAERRSTSVNDFVYILQKNGVINHAGYDDDLDYPDGGEVECIDYDFAEESESTA